MSSTAKARSSKALTNLQTATLVFIIGALASLVGDACHVASGTTEYLWDVPAIWRSAFWFPLAVGGAVLAAAWAGQRAQLPALRRRGRSDAAIGIAAVIALYALTAALRGEAEIVSVALTAAIAGAIWLWWDPSPGAFAIALGAAVLGPIAEMLIVEAGASRYAADSDGLVNVAPWLPCLYFAAGAVASGLWRAVQFDGAVDQSAESAISKPT